LQLFKLLKYNIFGIPFEPTVQDHESGAAGERLKLQPRLIWRASKGDGIIEKAENSLECKL
jgi:hypothetical protein